MDLQGNMFTDNLSVPYWWILVFMSSPIIIVHINNNYDHRHTQG